MTTTGKIAIGAAVVIGGVVVYKMLQPPTPVQAAAAKTNTTPETAIFAGFLNLAASSLNYFAKRPPQTQAVPGTSGAWDSSADLRLPNLPGTAPYGDSTRNDYLLS